MPLRIVPLGYRILVKLDETPETSSGGIIMVTHTKEQPLFGVIMDIAENCDLPQLQLGDRVFFKKFAGQEVTIEGNTFVVLEEDDLLGYIEEFEEETEDLETGESVEASQLP